jgi:hypothetical protein
MGHCVQAFIGTKTSLERIQQQYSASQVMELSQGMALLPMLDELYDAIPNEESTDLVDEHFQFLTPKIVELIIRFSKKEAVGYFETEYFGGAGDQGAILGKEGRIVFGPQGGDGSINSILSLMGVDAAGSFDEFTAVGLGRFRDNEDWIKQPQYRRLPARKKAWWTFW